MDRRKQLKQQYKERKPDMGVYAIIYEDAYYVDFSADLTAAFSTVRAKLRFGAFKDRNLQRAYTQNGGEGFEMKILEPLPPDKDGVRTDYGDDLCALRDMVIETLREQGKTAEALRPR